jgi:hypothetical protein
MPNLRKPFYHVDEVLERWSISERDLMSFVLSGALTVSATVAGLRVTYGICRPSAAGVTDRIASSHRYIIGIVPLQGCDTWRVMRQGEFAITALQTPADEFAMIDNPAGHNQHVVGKSDLVISHEELICFEKANPALAGQAEAEDGNRRGAPSRYQWDDIWVELCAMIFLDGLPETQNELVQHEQSKRASHIIYSNYANDDVIGQNDCKSLKCVFACQEKLVFEFDSSFAALFESK